MYRRIWTTVLAGCVCLVVSGRSARGLTPGGIVYESEAISTPKTAWQLNKRTGDHWMLWTQEADIAKKRSGEAVLAGPVVAADRGSPEEGAPPLHSVVTDLEPGVYLVYASNPGRPLGYSLDGKTWFKGQGREVFLGTHHIADGRFELWVDDRYAHPPNSAGPGYYDYVRFVRVPDSALNVERYPTWGGLGRWLEGKGGRSIPAIQMTDRVGFEVEGAQLKGGKTGDRFSYAFDRAGTFYLAVEMVDDGDGVEQLAVSLDGKEIACFVGDQPRDGTALYSVKQPIKVAKGDKLTFTCRTPVGCYRVHNLFLAAGPIVPPPPQFEHVEAWCPEAGSVDVCWTTSTIVETGLVEYGTGGQKTKTERCTYRGRNHRVQLRHLDPGVTCEARIVTEYEGKPLVSGTIRFEAQPKTPPLTQAQTIELTVPEPTEHPRRSWPATAGVPFARGKLAGAEDLRLTDDKGRPVALQAETFSRWPDGSVKWAVVSFVASAPAKGYRLTAQPGQAGAKQPGPTATVRRVDGGWRVETDILRFTLDEKAPDLFRELGVDLNGDGEIDQGETIAAGVGGANLVATDGDGAALTLGPTDAGGPKIEASGPVAAVVAWRGSLMAGGKPSAFRYVLRLRLWRGRPMMGVDVTVWNDLTKPAFSALGWLELRVPLAGGSGVRGSLEGQPLVSVGGEQGIWILQDRDNRYRLCVGDKATEGKRALGVAMAESDRARATVCVPDFWQTYPSGCAVKVDGIHVQLLPRLPGDAYTDPDSQKWYAQLYAWCQGGKYLFRAGQVTRGEVVVRFDRPGGENDARQFAGWVNHPLLPQASPEYMSGTGVLGRAIYPRTAGVWDSYEQMFDRCFANHLKDREKRRTYGWMHYGDWFGERSFNYGNNEYDLPWAMAVQWMRTGDRAVFDRGVQMARHYSTVDTACGAPAKTYRCLAWTHCYNHVGSERPEGELNFRKDDKAAQTYLEQYRWGLRGGMDPQGHIYQPGNWLYAALTGDAWLRETAERVCTDQAERLTPNFNFSIERSGGWPLINASMAYAFSGNPYYLNAARLMIERCLERQDPETGGWLHTPPMSETAGVRVRGGKAFAVGILTHGILRYLDQEPEDRPEVRKMLVRGVDWLMTESWIPGKGFRYISRAPNCRDTGRKGMTCLLNAEVVAYACEQTRDPKYVAFWKEMMSGVMDTMSEGMGKGFTQMVRQTVFGLDRIKPFGVTSLASEGPR
ncbi:MAG: hypothetical protein JXQ73_32625 [Phycisphaerae bacterium]|nr:hypothetical protein [Phycisphaerae bacterium]